MSNLVFIANDSIEETPFTTSKVVAEHGEVQHEAVQKLIRTHAKKLEKFGKLRFEIRPLPSGQSEKIYNLNEQQATLLITFMKNTDPVVDFKVRLVEEFYRMRNELLDRKVTRIKTKEARSRMADAIRDYIPDSPNKKYKYPRYTDLIYEIIFRKKASELKIERRVGKNKQLRDFFSKEELAAVERLERIVESLLALGYNYHQIKDELTKYNNVRQIG